ncbi:MAG: nicotinate-nucleotide adenylyltransferase [Candidatus Omnitrophica bacterium]|nr:nicotinate-nucleotide adenylyltransferase [Candidatus Omnitrophota bacterium]MDD5552642.1 nicotinate-nucleotide adenylyltransferase [Candidatus Omnitrophota bacterium]
MKIGLLGGTFNPIHTGHLILAEEVREKLLLDRIIFVPAYLPPHKDNSEIIPARLRLDMVRAAIKGNRHFSVSEIEIKRDGRSFTIDTIREFKKDYPGDKLYFIIGSDLLKYLDDWKDLDEIIKMVDFIAATRPGYPLERIPSRISTVPIRAVDISGFEIRKAIKENKSFRYLVPESVFNYIRKKRLYR